MAGSNRSGRDPWSLHWISWDLQSSGDSVRRMETGGLSVSVLFDYLPVCSQKVAEKKNGYLRKKSRKNEEGIS